MRQNQGLADMFVVADQIVHLGNAILQKENLTLRQFVALTKLSQEPSNMSDLAKRMHTAPAVITKSIDLLEKLGLAQRQDDPNDRRMYRVMLTPTGRRRQLAIRDLLSQEAKKRFGRDVVAEFLFVVDQMESQLSQPY